MDMDCSLDESVTPSCSVAGKKDCPATMLRKSNKPLMEKRRRERINNCLDQLKSILMEVTKKESSYYSKLEKADILEMTVKYLKTLKRQHAMSPSAGGGDNSGTEALCRYVAGFNECAKEVTQYLTSVGGGDVSADARTCLLGHLANSLQIVGDTTGQVPAANVTQLSAIAQSPTADLRHYITNCTQPLLPKPAAVEIAPSTSFLTQQQQQLPTVPTAIYVMTSNGNAAGSATESPSMPTTAQSIGHMQLVPARLPNGEVVFLLTTPPSAARVVTSSPVPLATADDCDRVLRFPAAADSTLQSPPPQWLQPQQQLLEYDVKLHGGAEAPMSSMTQSRPITASGLTSSTDGHIDSTSEAPSGFLVRADSDTVPFAVDVSKLVSGTVSTLRGEVGHAPEGVSQSDYRETDRQQHQQQNLAVKLEELSNRPSTVTDDDIANNNDVFEEQLMQPGDADLPMWRPW